MGGSEIGRSAVLKETGVETEEGRLYKGFVRSVLGCGAEKGVWL